MTEPTSSTMGLAVALVAVLGPIAGEYATIVFASLAGALWALSRAPMQEKAASALFLLRIVTAAAVFTSLLAYAVTRVWDVSASLALAPAAFFIGAVGDGWQSVIAGLLTRLRHRVGDGEGGKSS